VKLQNRSRNFGSYGTEEGLFNYFLFICAVSNKQNRFGLRGYAAAYVLPEGFETDQPGVEYARQIEADYAVITIYDPFAAAFDRIPHAYQLILEYLNCNGFKKKFKENVLPCFEWVYEKDGATYMDVFIHCDGVSSANIFTSFI